VLFVLYLGYLALRQVPGDPDRRARRSAIGALIAFVDVPIVHLSVEWWRTLHQEPTFLRRDLDPTIEPSMAVALWLSVLAYTLVYAWLLTHRFRVAWLEERAEDRLLEQAVAERQAEAELATR
jgi:heme exporter protein C